jgi:hypothetical protein
MPEFVWFQVVLENSSRADGHDCPFIQASIRLTNILCGILRIGEPRKYIAVDICDSIRLTQSGVTLHAYSGSFVNNIIIKT